MDKEALVVGDVVEHRHSISASCAGNRRFAVVYETGHDEIQIIAMLPDGLDRAPETIQVNTENLSEGSLPESCLIDVGRLYHIERDSSVRRIGHLSRQTMDKVLRGMAHKVIKKHYECIHSRSGEFVPGETNIQCAGRVYDDREMRALVDTAFDFWLTAGRFADQFEEDFARFLGVKSCALTNSGSSANLLAVSALTSPKLGDRQLNPGDEVITTACSFPTTVAPIIQNNLVPVFLDVDLGTYNVLADEIENALSEKTKAIILAHALGNPFDLDTVMKVASKHNLWVIEDSCDALGSTYEGKYTGSIGDIGTFSFYPAHHITMGEGGAVVTNNVELKTIIESFRDWGRDCWCKPGCDNTCGKRFGWQLGTLPLGYDHKYIYSHLGYNLKSTDMQAAIGVEQLRKLPEFVRARRRNWRFLHDELENLGDHFIMPRATSGSNPSWFGFVLTVQETAPFSRLELVRHLEKNRIATRLLFAGNITAHSCFSNVRYRTHGNLRNTDMTRDNTFWVGVYPGMTDAMTAFMVAEIRKFVGEC